jgi:hypothetical protein
LFFVLTNAPLQTGSTKLIAGQNAAY